MPDQQHAPPARTQPAGPAPQVTAPPRGFGSNQDRLAQLRQAGTGGPQAATPQVATPQAAAPQAAAPQLAAPQVAGAGDTASAPTLDRTAVGRTLRKGRNGEDVKALQRFLGLEGEAVDGDYGPATAALVVAWQKAHALKESGAVDTATLAAMRGDALIYGYSTSHDPDKFAPKYPMTAYHESGIYRDKADPYAVGAITNPSQEDDDGGKTYGTYQFESYVYRDGSQKKGAFEGSTLMRFVEWKDNPYGERLKAVVKEKGVASAAFDTLWSELTEKENKKFGTAQQRFLEVDVGGKVDAFLTAAGADATAMKDSRLRDLAMGTLNQYGGIASSHARAAAEAQAKAKRTFTADELGRAIQDHKADNVTSNFSRSPGAQDGVKERIKDERAVFNGK